METAIWIHPVFRLLATAARLLASQLLDLRNAQPASNGPCVADYRPETCAYCQTDTWCEIRANGKPQCRACKVERFFAKILYPPLGYRLLGWQRKVLRDIYGTVSPENGRRRYRSA